MDIVILDTNVLIDNPRAIYGFPNDIAIIPIAVLEELDKLKDSRDSNVRRQARKASWLLDDITEENEEERDILLKNGGFLRIETNYQNEFKTYEPEKPDNRIMSVAIGYAKKIKATEETDVSISQDSFLKEAKQVLLYSNDVNVRVMIRQIAVELKLNLKAKKYKLVDTLDEIDNGITEFLVPSDKMAEFRKVKHIDTDGFKIDFVNGEHILLRDEANFDNTILCQYDSKQNKFIKLPDYKKGTPIWRIGGISKGAVDVRPRDMAQTFMAHDLLDTNKSLHFVLSKIAGAGKNYIATACSLSLLKDGAYDKLIIIKPMKAVDGEDTGFLPGNKDEKIAPWFESFNDTMYELTNGNQISIGEINAKIELEVVTHMRGRSIPNTIIIIDEAQNFSEEAIKTLITRAGKNSKIILMGDLSQIDNPRLDSSTSGLRIWAKRARNKETGFEDSTYILLEGNFRSKLSAWASTFYE